MNLSWLFPWRRPRQTRCPTASSRRSRRPSRRPRRANIHALLDANGLPVALKLEGQAHDGRSAADMLEILAQLHPAGGTILRHLIGSCDRTTARIGAINSPFKRNDDLKRRGHHWGDGSEGQPKAWWVEVDELTLADELEFLRREIYGWNAEPIV